MSQRVLTLVAFKCNGEELGEMGIFVENYDII